jgi:hypothetical protein
LFRLKPITINDARISGGKAVWAIDLLHQRAPGGAELQLPQCSIPRNMDGFRPVSANIMTT